jgi:hypothetical protein
VSAESNDAIRQNASGKVEVILLDGAMIICDNTGRKLPRETLAALERAGLNAANSLLYRSAMHHVAEE